MDNSIVPARLIDPDDIGHNSSSGPDFNSVLQARVSRRAVLKGGLGIAVTSMFGSTLSGCNAPLELSFSAVPKSLADAVTVPEEYAVTVLYALGDPLDNSVADYANDGSETAASFEHRAGDHHDGLEYFGLDAAGRRRADRSSVRGLLAMNHENITRIFLHTAAQVAAFDLNARPREEVDKETAAHGVSIVEVMKNGASYSVNRSSSFNRRITATTPIEISGPARGDDLMKTKYSPAGTRTRGTLNNCAVGCTPWGTYLTCEENWAGYFKRPTAADNLNRSAKEVAALTRYGVGSNTGTYGWANSTTAGDLYDRWNAVVSGATAGDDYRNAANTMGWVVEIDPYDPVAAPRKHTALARFNHEGVWAAQALPGKPIVFYMGDDARNDYIYKFVSKARWNPADADNGLAAGAKYLDNGTLYVARFNSDGTGQWLKLDIGVPAIASYATYPFANQVDVLVHARLAADAVGATKMDRPEWGAVNPVNGEVYMTLTNNSQRANSSSQPALDAANPRYYADGANRGNVNGHIIRWREAGADASATMFTWDIYLFGAQANVDAGGDNAYYQANVNLSGLTDDNDFSSPDGLWFSEHTPGLLWIETDDGAYTDTTNCMLLAAVPGRVGDGGAKIVLNLAVPQNGGGDQTVTTRAGEAPGKDLKRFLVGPKGCEITGITETPDGRAIFVNIQHPGEDTAAANIGNPANYQSHWPANNGTARPRSATIVITRNNGGVIAV